MRTIPLPDRERLSRAAPRLFFELLVVFVGVSAAFVVENYRETHEKRSRTEAIYTALESELDGFVRFAPGLVRDMDGRLERYAAARRAGQRPPPPFYREAAGERVPTTVWDATLTSGAVSLIDPALFYRLAIHYNRVNSISDRYARYNAFTESSLLPLLEGGPAGFYDPATGELRREFRAHMDRLREIRGAIAASQKEAEAVLRDVRGRLGR